MMTQRNKSVLLTGAAAVILALLSGCLGFFQQSPRYVDGTNILIRSSDRGDDYLVKIGESNTTVVDAVLSGNGSFYISYTYKDAEWLLVQRLVFETYCCTSSLESTKPVRKEADDGTVLEFEEIGVKRNLFEQMIESDTPLIYIEGEQGSVIIKMGSGSKNRLKELLDFGTEQFG
jgi:hypothetical protein